MFKITKTGVFCFVIITMFFCVQIFIQQYSIETEINENIMEEQKVETNIEAKLEVEDRTNKIWRIEIPKISLKADISEGTTKEILNQFVGHFEITSKETGNVGLAAHNRGYEVNFFKELKTLTQGDEIKYKHDEFEKIYVVEKCRIIRDTEWEYLEETEENMLTLITCVENQPEYRRCIQAIEKEEEIY